MLQTLWYASPIEFLLFSILVVTTFSGTGLVAIWAGMGRGHWFVRMIVVVAVIALPLVIPAYELAVLFAVQSAFTTLSLLVLQRFGRRSVSPDGGETPVATVGRAQLLLRDLLLATVIAALTSAVFAGMPREILNDWAGLVLRGLGLAMVTLGGAWIGLGRSRLWLRLVLLCLLLPAALIALFLSLVRTTSPSDGRGTTAPWFRRLAGGAVMLLILLILLPPSLVFYELSTPRPIPRASFLTGPNSYPDLIRAGQALVKVVLPTDASPPKPLKPFVVQYRSVLDKAHAALQKPCHVSLRYDPVDVDIALSDMEAVRQLAQAFDVEGRLAHREGRNDDAVRILLDEFRLGNAVSRGGLVIDVQVGWAIESIGYYRVAAIRDSFSAKQCRELIDALQKIKAEKEPLEEVFARDEAWEDHVYDWQNRLSELLSRTAGRSTKPGVQFARTVRQAEMQLLLGELALRAYRQEHGQFPAALSDLVPEYLPAVPQDPLSGKSLIYRRTSTGHLLYSFGADRKDDGGQRPRSSSAPGDLLLEEPGAGESDGEASSSEEGQMP